RTSGECRFMLFLVQRGCQHREARFLQCLDNRQSLSIELEDPALCDECVARISGLSDPDESLEHGEHPPLTILDLQELAGNQSRKCWMKACCHMSSSMRPGVSQPAASGTATNVSSQPTDVATASTAIANISFRVCCCISGSIGAHDHAQRLPDRFRSATPNFSCNREKERDASATQRVRQATRDVASDQRLGENLDDAGIPRARSKRRRGEAAH